jgi:hypothetical protein
MMKPVLRWSCRPSTAFHSGGMTGMVEHGDDCPAERRGGHALRECARHSPYRGGDSQMPAFFTASTLGLWMGIVSLICGIIVMIFPKILNYLIGIYLIIIGVLALVAYFA